GAFGNSAFFSKINATGDSLLYSTYYGSTVSNSGTAIALDPNGNAYITGFTAAGGTFPTTSGAYQTTGGGGTDAFAAKFNPNPRGSSSLVYGSLLGGAGNDQANGIAVDQSGNAYVAGQTGSTGGTAFPTTTGAYQTTFGSGSQDAFLTKLNATGTALSYS